MRTTYPLVTLADAHLRRACEIREAFVASKDIDLWCENIEYEMFRAALPQKFFGVLYHGTIVIQRRLTEIQELLTVAHEIFHNEFHGYAEAYRVKQRGRLSQAEAQSELWATLMIEPPGMRDRYPTDEEYFGDSRLPNDLKVLRLRACEKYGW